MAQKPLNPQGGVSPMVGIRMVPQQRKALDDIAARRGCSMSDVVRQAVDALLAAEEALSA